jgi:syntaxin 16
VTASHSPQSLAYADPSLDLRARNHQLTEIANNIAALAELFKDLSALVIDQGTLLDSVEYNIEQTAVHIQESVMELEMATRFVFLGPFLSSFH